MVTIYEDRIHAAPTTPPRRGHYSGSLTAPLPRFPDATTTARTYNKRMRCESREIAHAVRIAGGSTFAAEDPAEAEAEDMLPAAAAVETEEDRSAEEAEDRAGDPTRDPAEVKVMTPAAVSRKVTFLCICICICIRISASICLRFPDRMQNLCSAVKYAELF